MAKIVYTLPLVRQPEIEVMDDGTFFLILKGQNGKFYRVKVEEVK